MQESLKQDSRRTYNLLIASYLEPEFVERIRQVSPRLQVIYRPDLLPKPRYPADHYNTGRSPEAEAAWRELLGQAEILFDFDYTNQTGLPELAPHLLWIQASSAGIGQFVRRNGYDTRMPAVTFTTSSGIHARPLAEFVILALLAHYKGMRQMLANQERKTWQRYAGGDLEERVLGVVGLGKIGSQVARSARALGMRALGTNMTPNREAVERFFEPGELHDMLPLVDALVLCVPHTPHTEKMIGAAELALLKPGAYLINISRGAVLDEAALIEALRAGKLGGAALDVFEQEPLPAASPLWEMPNVLVSPHSGSTSERENQRLTELFCSNLQRFLEGAPLMNVLDKQLMY